ncbi:MAG TPA: hemolysin family protein [Longimicrobiaceae bacterium]|nr:hemolysin family protein [Longimicrobiaceae bacterium]
MDDPDPGSLTLLAILALIAANAFLVAAEFALIAVRRTRIEQNVRQGDPLAARVLPALDRLEELVFAAQVARSGASVALGYFAFRAGREYLLPLFGPGRTASLMGLTLTSSEAAATALAVAVVVLLHATLGQQAPKLVAIHRAEWITAHVAVPPLRVLAWVLRPLLWPLGWLVRGVVRLFGVRSTGFHPLMQTQEEIRLLVERASDRADIEDEEREMIRGVFEISETAAREVMTPRTAMVAVPVEVTLAELVRVAAEEGHSRLPVYEGTIDSIVGIVLTKDLLRILQARLGGAGSGEPFDVRAILRPAYFVPDT